MVIHSRWERFRGKTKFWIWSRYANSANIVLGLDMQTLEKHPVYGFLTEQEYKSMITSHYGEKDYYLKIARKRERGATSGKKKK